MFIPSSIVLEVTTELIVGLVATCTGAFVDNVIILAGGGRVAGGGLVFVGGLVTAVCVTKCSGFEGFSGTGL